MKKVLVFAIVASALAFTACGGKKTEKAAEGVDTTATVAPMDTAAPVMADTSAKMDTAAAAAAPAEKMEEKK